MKKLMRYSAAAAMLAVILLVGAVCCQAAEVQLAGVRLNDSVMNLINRTGWGLPEGIGPLAQTGASATSNSARPAGSTARGIGMADRLPPQLAAGINRQSGVTASPVRGTGVQAQAPADKKTNELRGTGGLQYWLYSKANGVKVILSVEPSGNIANITVQGPASREIRTSRGIGLGSSYFDLINFYGYPENSQPIASGLRVVYSDQDVIFTLQNLRVTEITVGKPPALPAPSARGPMGVGPAGGGGGGITGRQ
jgi:hypothetical protein